MSPSNRKCVHRDCDARKNYYLKDLSDITFFSFPMDVDMCVKWMKCCSDSFQRKPLVLEKLYNSSHKICGRHFRENDFVSNKISSKKLKPEAVPDVGLGTGKKSKHDTHLGFLKERSARLMKKRKPRRKVTLKKNKLYELKKEEASRIPPQPPPLIPPLREESPVPPLSPLDTGPCRNKDLVSPQRLMNIMENSCPLIRPISPIPSEPDDGLYLPLVPEVSMAPSLSPPARDCNDEQNTDIDDDPCHNHDSVLSDIQKRGLQSSDSETAEQPRKYKKILPKSDVTRGDGATIILRSSLENAAPIIHDGDSEEVLNLSNLRIEILEKAPKGGPAALTTTLYLDNNLLQTLPTIDSYRKLTKLSVSQNQIDSLIWFGRLQSLKTLNVSDNKISKIDGLWKMGQLQHVNLSGNCIQVLRCHGRDSKSRLEHLDVSSNKITTVEDLSMLTNLTQLFLHQNQLSSLSEFSWKLPASLTKLTLAENILQRLGDVAELSALQRLKKLTLSPNQCLNVLQLVDTKKKPVGAPRYFNYRPYVITWCQDLSLLDDSEFTQEERAKAKWLLSEGITNAFSVENHAALVTYLSEVCPRSPPRTISGIQSSFPLPPLNPENVVDISLPPLASTLDAQSSPSSSVSAPPVPSEAAAQKKSFSRAPKCKKSHNKASHSTSDAKLIDCSKGGPCTHYIELIEEKARNHKLQRHNEELQLQNDELMDRIHILETMLSQKEIDFEQVFVKVEVDEEDVDLFPSEGECVLPQEEQSGVASAGKQGVMSTIRGKEKEAFSSFVLETWKPQGADDPAPSVESL